MPAPYPVVIPKAFGINAAGPNRNLIPADPLTTQRASWQLGFPPLTMTPIPGGGKPMLGPDMNGVLYALSSHSVYTQSGQAYRYNADVVVAIAGYAVGTLLSSVDGLTLWFNTVGANTTDPDAGGAGWVSFFSHGITTLAGLVGGIVTPSAAEAARSVIVVAGALVANLTLVLPKQYRRWLIVNATSGAFSVSTRTIDQGVGINIPAAGFPGPTEVWCNGVAIFNVVQPAALPISVASVADTIVQRSNTADVYARAFNSTFGADVLGVVNAIYDAGDGWFRKIPFANFQQQISLPLLADQVTPEQVPESAVTQHKAAILVNAALTGVPTTPTAPIGTRTIQVASTAFAAGAFVVYPSGNWSWTTPSGMILKGGAHTFGDLVAGFGTNVFAVAFEEPFPHAILTGGITLGRTGDCRAAVPFYRSPTPAGFQLGMEEWVGINQGGDNAATYICVGY